MKACMLSMKGNFDKNIGQGVQRYMYGMWTNTSKILNRSSPQLDKVELGFGTGLGTRKVSFTILSKLYNFKKYDLVHTLAPIMFNPGLRSDANMVTTVHEFVMVNKDNPLYSERESGIALNPRMLAGKYIEKSMRRQILDSDYILPNSTQTMEEAIKFGCDKNKLIIVSHGFDSKFLQKERASKRKTFTIGFVGAFNIRKNAGFAIKAVKKMTDRKVEFHVWGKPTLNYDKFVKLASGDPRIRFMGFAPEEKLVSIYDSFDVFAFPTWYEGFGLEILEAQTRGIPVVIYKKGKVPKEVRKYCFEAEDEAHMAQLIQKIKDNGYNEKKMKEAKKYASQFTLENTAKNTVDVYRKILGS